MNGPTSINSLREPIRILLIPSSDYIGHPFPQRYNHIFERLHGKDIEVHVIRFALKSEPALQTRVIIHELNVEFKCPSIAQYYLANFVNHNMEVLNIIKREGIDVIVVSNLSPCYIVSLVKSAFKLDVRTIFDLQDYYPISAAGYIASRDSALYSISASVLHNIMRQLIWRSEAVSAASRLLKRLAEKLGAKRAYFIPNGIPEYFVPYHKREGMELKAKLGLEKSIIIGYVGSIEFWLDFDPILKAVKQLAADNIPVHLVLIGGRLHTKYENYLMSRIEELKIQDYVLRLGFIRHDALPPYIAMFDFGLIPFDTKNPLNFFIEEPLKLWEYLSQGAIPLSSPLKGIVRYNNEFVYTYRDSKDIYDIVRKYSVNEGRFIATAIKGREFAKNNRIWSRIAREFKRVIYDVLGLR